MKVALDNAPACESHLRHTAHKKGEHNQAESRLNCVVNNETGKQTLIDGRYLITGRVGHGGMATVYHGWDERLERDVAIKFMHPHLADDASFAEAFVREARAAARISSPYTVAIYDSGTTQTPQGEQLYLAMEYVEGPDVRSELERLGSLSLGNAITITTHTLRALAAFHAQGLIHRDVKPENILLTTPLDQASTAERSDVLAKLTDFGLTRVMSSQAMPSQVVGTVSYLAPEVISQDAILPSSDLYSLGIMLYEFLTGHVPFHAGTAIATAYQHLNAVMPRARTEAEWLPESIDSFIALLTAKSPQQRPANAQEALDIFEAITADIPQELLIRRVPVIGSAQVDAANSGRWNSSAHRRRTATAVEVPAATAVANVTARLSETSFSRPSEAATQPPLGDTAQLTSPDEHTTRALTAEPTRALTVQEPSAQPNKRVWLKRIPLVLLIVALAAIATVAWYFGAGPGSRVRVPDVVGQERAYASSIIEAQQLRLRAVEEYSDTVPEGKVIATEPEAGEMAAKKSTVTIHISLGVEQVEVPAVISLSQDEALTALEEARLKAQVSEEYSESVPQGKVISQAISAGDKVDHDSAVPIVISKGRQPIDVPSLAGKTQEEALAALEALTLVGEVSQEYSDTVPKGQVIASSPDSGQLFKGDKVQLRVSLGPEIIAVPNVVGQAKNSAVKALEAAGFKVEIKNALGAVALGLVYSQSPTGSAPKGSTITISLV